MTNSTTASKSNTQSPTTVPKNVSPWRCWLGTLISGSLAIALYLLTSSIAHTFAAKPIPSTNPLAMNIAVAVRTLVMGIAALGTGVFGLVALGLFALGIQILVQRLRKA